MKFMDLVEQPRLFRTQWLLSIFIITSVAACTPTVRVAADKPITINLNVKIEHEIRVKVDKELDDLFANDSELF